MRQLQLARQQCQPPIDELVAIVRVKPSGSKGQAADDSFQSLFGPDLSQIG